MLRESGRESGAARSADRSLSTGEPAVRYQYKRCCVTTAMERVHATFVGVRVDEETLDCEW